ncbi:MAG: heparinase II/III family protein [Armatimonadota bacterium]|jgi:hypothetical protein
MRAIIQERAEMLSGFAGQAYAEATAEMLERAQRIAQGTVFFYGSTPVEVGLRDVDWGGGHVKHQEWPAQLNRFFHLSPLASAYISTGDEKFAQAARAYIEDWIAYDAGYENATRFRPGDSGLNMAGRLGSSHSCGWTGSLPAFLKSPAFDDAFLETMMASIGTQVEFLSRHLTGWGNWRIAELDTVVFTTLRLPFLPGAKELLGLGITGMRNALATQFLPDGVHVERSPGYHHWMADVLATYYDLGRRFPDANAHVEADMVVKAWDYAAQSDLFGVNDSRAPHRDPKVMRSSKTRFELLKRLMPERRIRRAAPLEQVFPRAGHAFSRSAWKPGADFLAFDASTWGGGHCHLSRLSFVLRSGGRQLVADPGILNYEMSDPLGPYGKSTRAHSTISLNGWNQSEADAQLLRTEFTQRSALIHARYQGGYWPGDFGWSFMEGHGSGVHGTHERVLFWVKGEYIVVLDAVRSDSKATAHNSWQMGPMEGWAGDGSALTWRSHNADTNLLMQFASFQNGPVEMECFEGSRDPLRGWVGHRGDDALPAPLVEFRYPVEGGAAVTAALLVPFTGSAAPGYSLRRKTALGWAQVRHLEIIRPDGLVDHIGWSQGLSASVDSGDPFVTDAPFVWLRSDSTGEATECFLLDGSYLECGGRKVYDGVRREAAFVTLG